MGLSKIAFAKKELEHTLAITMNAGAVPRPLVILAFNLSVCFLQTKKN